MAFIKSKGYARRWKLAIAPCLLLCFMYGLWGGVEVFAGNASSFRFTFWELLLPLSLFTAGASALMATLISFLRRRVFSFMVSLLLAVSVCSYVQYTFLNRDLGLLDGEVYVWPPAQTAGNLLIWAALLVLIVFLLMRMHKYGTRRTVRRLSMLLLALQAVSFGIVSAQHLASDTRSARDTTYVLTGNQQYDVSAEGNVIVFMLDYFSNDYIDRTVEQYPGILDCLQDFTYYDNCDPTYIGTFPSVVHMLTGNAFDNTVPIDTWFRQSWESDTAHAFYGALAEKGYKFHFFDSNNDYFGIRYAEPYVENLRKLTAEDYTVRYDRVAGSMLQLSAYRFAPFLFKPALKPDAFSFYRAVPLNGGEVESCLNRNAFYNRLVRDGLRVVEGDGKYFIIEFLKGTHPPYHLDAAGQLAENPTLEETAAGYLTIFAQYLQALKMAGLYDSSTIILTSDHGDKENSMQVMYFIKEAGVRRDSMAVSSAPISHKEMLGTVLKNIGADCELPSIYDFSDGEVRERTVMRNFIDPKYPFVPKYNSTAVGTHTVMYAYTYTGDRRALRKQFRRGPTEILPLTESFN